MHRRILHRLSELYREHIHSPHCHFLNLSPYSVYSLERTCLVSQDTIPNHYSVLHFHARYPLTPDPPTPGPQSRPPYGRGVIIGFMKFFLEELTCTKTS